MELSGILTIVVLALTTGISLWYWLQKRPGPNFPPGPKGWPVIGNMLDFIGIAPHLLFMNLAQKYGDVISIKLGSRWTVVLNGSKTIRDALVHNPVQFAGRPNVCSGNIVSEGGKDIAFSQYTPTWKLHRKLVHSAFRSLVTGDRTRFENLVFTMTSKVGKILEGKGEEPFDPKNIVSVAIYNFLTSMLFGKKYELDDPQLLECQRLEEEIGKAFGNGLMADYFPLLEYLPSKGLRAVSDITQRWIRIIDPELDRHRKTYIPGDKPKDLVEIMLEAKQKMLNEGEDDADRISDVHMRQTVKDVFIAGSDTSINTMHWAIACMVDFPEVQGRIQAELDDVIGKGRFPSLDDRGSLPYTESALYEVMRYSSVVSLALPHATTEDVTFAGYAIPKGTWVLPNLYSAHFDKKLWGDPKNFRPEHFLDDSGKLREHPEGFLPFSAGRRVCLGEAIARAELFLIFTWLFQNFVFYKPAGKGNEVYSAVDKTTVNPKLEPYEVIVTKRDG